MDLGGGLRPVGRVCFTRHHKPPQQGSLPLNPEPACPELTCSWTNNGVMWVRRGAAACADCVKTQCATTQKHNQLSTYRVLVHS